MLLQRVILALSAAASVTAGIVPADAMVTPAAKLSRSSPGKKILMSDRRKDGEDFVEWQERMIAAGKLYRPKVTSVNGTGLIARDGTTWSLSNIACGFIVGKPENYITARNSFCGIAASGNEALYNGIELIFQGAVDDNDEEETLLEYIFLQAPRWFSAAYIDTTCPSTFDELFSQCGGNTGGSAHIELSNPDLGSTSGYIENQWYANDDTATCPATTTDYCKVTAF